MRHSKRSIAIPGLLVLGLTAAVWADSPSALDNALDDKSNATQPAPAAAGEKTDAVDPNAAREVDSEDLVKKLTGESPDTTTGNPQAMLQEVLERMGTSSKRLQERDPGTITQETQRRIILNLDTLIKLAQQQQQGGGSGKSSERSNNGQKRQQNPGNQSGDKHNPGGDNPATTSQLPGGSSDPAQSNGQDIREKSTEWGNLPERERDLIINGVKEEPLPAYRQAVQQYYKALADINKSGHDNR